ncbi:hypothetical protein FQA47_011317 [Oryzias melastigma]|uniref:Uncharacterized protein n=1 Tax=Oryzias melastigma TaxID=30732 RepID=A0A834F4U0_ORYME|nr:hypothetical protein FQA47_018681 [Oryzias melastigma]KAF6718904.1 hypothetical protein FQA47_011317 [Oryzias melastigma]
MPCSEVTCSSVEFLSHSPPSLLLRLLPSPLRQQHAFHCSGPITQPADEWASVCVYAGPPSFKPPFKGGKTLTPSLLAFSTYSAFIINDLNHLSFWSLAQSVNEI